MIPEILPDLTIYLKGLLRANKPQHQDNTFWFSTPKNHGKNQNLTTIQTRLLKDMYELKEKRKLNPKEDTES